MRQGFSQSGLSLISRPRLDFKWKAWRAPFPREALCARKQSGTGCAFNQPKSFPLRFPGWECHLPVFLLKWLVEAKGSSQEKRAAVSLLGQLQIRIAAPQVCPPGGEARAGCAKKPCCTRALHARRPGFSLRLLNGLGIDLGQVSQNLIFSHL